MNPEKETRIEILDRLYSQGDLKKLVSLGVISSRWLVWRNMFHAFNQRLESTGSKMKAMNETAANFNVSRSLVEKVRRYFQE